TGSFAAATNVGVGGSLPWPVAVGDFNNDGKQDLATGKSGASNVYILLGNCVSYCANFTFAPAANYGTGSQPYALAVGDFNRDGIKDLATANYNASNVSILLGTGTGSFGAATNYATGPSPNAITVGDFNNDGNQDLAVAGYSNIE